MNSGDNLVDQWLAGLQPSHWQGFVYVSDAVLKPSNQADLPLEVSFIFLAILEDSGYLARAAFVMDRLMRFIGLPGKSFVPMMVGFGCNIPGIMATRTLKNRRDRLVG